MLQYLRISHGSDFISNICVSLDNPAHVKQISLLIDSIPVFLDIFNEVEREFDLSFPPIPAGLSPHSTFVICVESEEVCKATYSLKRRNLVKETDKLKLIAKPFPIIQNCYYFSESDFFNIAEFLPISIVSIKPMLEKEVTFIYNSIDVRKIPYLIRNDTLGNYKITTDIIPIEDYNNNELQVLQISGAKRVKIVRQNWLEFDGKYCKLLFKN